MSLTFERSIATTAVVIDGVERGTGNELCTTDSSTRFQRWNITTGTQQGSTVTVTSGSNLCMVSTASAFLTNSGTSGQLVEVSSGYLQSYSGGAAQALSNKAQQSCKVGNYVFYTAFNAGNIGRFDYTTFTNSSQTLAYQNSGTVEKLYTLLTLSNGNFLAGTDRGCIVELTSSLAAVQAMDLFYEMDNSYNVQQQTLGVSGLSQYGDLLLVTTFGGLAFQVHWPSKSILHVFSHGDSTSATQGGTPLCASASGVIPYAISGGNQISNASMLELEFTQSPPIINDIVYGTSSSFWSACGIQDGRFWASLRDNTIKVCTYAATRQFDNVTSSLTDGSAKSGRIIRMIDTAGGAYVELDTAVSTSGSSLPTTDGKSVIELAVYGDGVDEKAALSTYTT